MVAQEYEQELHLRKQKEAFGNLKDPRLHIGEVGGSGEKKYIIIDHDDPISVDSPFMAAGIVVRDLEELRLIVGDEVFNSLKEEGTI